MGQALYRKYRSRSLDEIVGQEHITTTLKNALSSGKISHAYLFTGPRGVGKTSIARILAYEINGIPYSDDTQQHLDIIEIDAASNRRIDEIRELRDKVNVAPTSAKYKVYIIDEVHMLTREAFNALLKTLEEPPKHVIFILATTEIHKLPETIVSRTQRFTFRPIDNKKAIEHLRVLADKEGIDIDDESLELIAEHGRGSFRDSINLLDQLSAQQASVSPENVRAIVGIPSTEAIEDIMKSVSSGNSFDLATQISEIVNQGYPPSQIAKQISSQISSREVLSEDEFTLLRQLMDTPVSHDPKTYLELTLLEAAFRAKPTTTGRTVKTEEPQEQITEIHEEQIAQTTTQPPKKHAEPGDLWSQTLESLKGKHNTLYGIARMAEAEQQDDKLTLTFGFPFHQRRCNEVRNRERIEDILKELSGKNIKLECVVGATSQKVAKPSQKHKPKEIKKSDTLESITEVFGGGEVLD